MIPIKEAEAGKRYLMNVWDLNACQTQDISILEFFDKGGGTNGDLMVKICNHRDNDRIEWRCQFEFYGYGGEDFNRKYEIIQEIPEIKIAPEKVIKVEPITIKEGESTDSVIGVKEKPFMQPNEFIILLLVGIIGIYNKADLTAVCACIMGAAYFIVNAINKLKQ